MAWRFDDEDIQLIPNSVKSYVVRSRIKSSGSPATVNLRLPAAVISEDTLLEIAGACG